MQKNIDFDRLRAKDLAQYIDHTLLKPTAYRNEIKTLCEEAVQNGFFSVCVNSAMLNFAKEYLRGTQVKICAVVGFPLGACETLTKAFEAGRCINMGAHEIDFVLNIGAVKNGDSSYTKREVEEIVRASDGHTVKVILETALLSDDEKRRACELSMEAGADFVKTSTGFSGGGATVTDILLMKSVVGDKVQIKASGGIKDFAFAKELMIAGATRLGTSSGIQIINNATATGDY